MSKETCLCIDLRSVAQRLTQIYDEAMAPSGITVTQFSQMALIRRLQGPTLTQLSAESQQDRSTLGRNVRLLEKMQLVVMKKGQDARTKTIHLTSQGEEKLLEAKPLWRTAQDELVGRLGASGRNQLNDMLAIITQPLAAQ